MLELQPIRSTADTGGGQGGTPDDERPFIVSKPQQPPVNVQLDAQGHVISVSGDTAAVQQFLQQQQAQKTEEETVEQTNRQQLPAADQPQGTTEQPAPLRHRKKKKTRPATSAPQPAPGHTEPHPAGPLGQTPAEREQTQHQQRAGRQQPTRPDAQEIPLAILMARGIRDRLPRIPRRAQRQAPTPAQRVERVRQPAGNVEEEVIEDTEEVPAIVNEQAALRLYDSAQTTLRRARRMRPVYAAEGALAALILAAAGIGIYIGIENAQTSVNAQTLTGCTDLPAGSIGTATDYTINGKATTNPDGTISVIRFDHPAQFCRRSGTATYQTVGTDRSLEDQILANYLQQLQHNGWVTIDVTSY